MPISRLQSSKERHEAGFTLIELMVGVALIGILATIAAPSFTRQIESNRQRAASAQLQQAIRLANSQALATSRPVVLCASDDGEACGDSWSEGWLLFVDRDRDGSVSADDRVLLVSDNSEDRLYQVESGIDRLVFRANGVTSATTIRICSDKDASTDLDIQLSAFGLTTIVKGVSGGCG